jgi:hypothetical protein
VPCASRGRARAARVIRGRRFRRGPAEARAPPCSRGGPRRVRPYGSADSPDARPSGLRDGCRVGAVLRRSVPPKRRPSLAPSRHAAPDPSTAQRPRRVRVPRRRSFGRWRCPRYPPTTEARQERPGPLPPGAIRDMRHVDDRPVIAGIVHVPRIRLAAGGRAGRPRAAQDPPRPPAAVDREGIGRARIFEVPADANGPLALVPHPPTRRLRPRPRPRQRGTRDGRAGHRASSRSSRSTDRPKHRTPRRRPRCRTPLAHACRKRIQTA